MNLSGKLAQGAALLLAACGGAESDAPKGKSGGGAIFTVEERRIIDRCLEDGFERGECDCQITTLKNDLSDADYQFALRLMGDVLDSGLGDEAGASMAGMQAAIEGEGDRVMRIGEAVERTTEKCSV
jgi:hypothetical protein